MILKFHTFGLIALINYFSHIQNNEIDHMDTILNMQLLADYQTISEFSKTMQGYKVSATHFQSLFHEGLKKSLHFHQSSIHMKQSEINAMIAKKFFHCRHLQHQVEKPLKNTTKRDKSFAVLNTFSGEWSGKWKAVSVRHLWLSTQKCNINVGTKYDLIGFQTCFTGDWFGWNYLVHKDGKIIILGYVYHFNEKGKLDFENPHYAFLNDQSQLTWVSDTHIYYEFVCEEKHSTVGKHYVINEIPYHNHQKELKFGNVFQAIYTSENRLVFNTRVLALVLNNLSQ